MFHNFFIKGNIQLVENIESEINDINEKTISIENIENIISDIFEKNLVLCEKRKTKTGLDSLYIKIGESIESSISHHLILKKPETGDIFILKLMVPYLLKKDDKKKLSYKTLNDMNKEIASKISVFDEDDNEDGRIVIEDTIYFFKNSTQINIKKLVLILFKNVDDPDINLKELLK